MFKINRFEAVIILHIIAFLILNVCVRAQTPLAKEIRIDPAYTLSLPASEVLDEVTYIPLETTKESVFGSIYKLFITADNFIIYDKDSHSILLFSKSGKFQKKFPIGTYDSPGFLVNKQEKEIITLRGSMLNSYGFDGVKKREVRGSFPGSPYFFPDNRMVYSYYGVKESVFRDTIVKEVSLTENGKKYAEFLPYNSKTSPIETGDWVTDNHYVFYEGGNDTTVFYCRPYDYNIYKVTPTGLSREFSFILPLANTLPDTFSTTLTLQKGNRRAYFATNKFCVSGISFPYQSGNVLFFKLNSWENSLGNGDSYMYHTKSGTLVSVGGITADEKSYFLPVTDLHEGDEFYNRNFLTSDNQYIYTSISAANLLRLKDKSSHAVSYPENLRNFLKKGSRLDNPVIVALKPKTEF